MMRVGQVIRFLYPAANYRGVRPRMESRVLRIDRVLLDPAPAEAVLADPYLDRAGELVCGEDLDKHEPRSFYAGKMSEIEEVELLPETDEVYRIVAVDRAGRERLAYPIMEQHRARAYVNAGHASGSRSHVEAREIRLPAVTRNAAGKLSC